MSEIKREELEARLREEAARGPDRPWESPHRAWSVIQMPGGPPADDGKACDVVMELPGVDGDPLRGHLLRESGGYRLTIEGMPDSARPLYLTVARAVVSAAPAEYRHRAQAASAAASSGLAAAPADAGYRQRLESADIRAELYLPRGSKRLALWVQLPVATKAPLERVRVDFERTGSEATPLRLLVPLQPHQDDAVGERLLPLTMRDVLQGDWTLRVSQTALADVPWVTNRQLTQAAGVHPRLFDLETLGEGAYRVEPTDEERRALLADPAATWLLELELADPIGGPRGLSVVG